MAAALIQAKATIVGYDQLVAALNQKGRDLGDKAAIATVNDLAAQAKTRMSKLIREGYNISAALVRERLSVRKAFRKGTYRIEAYLIGNPEASGGKRAMNLIHFVSRADFKRGGGRRLKSGTVRQLTFRIKKARGAVIVRGAFIGNQGRTVFQRVNPDDPRSRIKAVSTIGIPQMFSTKENIRNVSAFIRDNFPRIFASQARKYISGIRR